MSIQSKKQNALLGSWIKNDKDLIVVQTYNGKRIGQFDHEDMKKLVEVMGKWRFLLGVNNDSSDSELVFICQFVYDNFKTLTIEDVTLAMNWAISGVTDMTYVSKKNLSAAYVSKALNLYEEEKRAIIQRIAYEKEAFERRKSLDEPLVVSPEDKAKTFIDILINAYNEYKNEDDFYDFGDFIYNWMKRNKIVNPTKEVVQQAMIHGEKKASDFKKDGEEGQKRKRIYESAMNDKEYRKKKFAREYIISKLFDQVPLDKLIKLVRKEQFQ